MPLIKRVHKNPNNIIQISDNIYCDLNKNLLKKVPSVYGSYFLFEEIDLDKLIDQGPNLGYGAISFTKITGDLYFDSQKKLYRNDCGFFSEIDLDVLISKVAKEDMLEYSVMNCTNIGNFLLKVDSKTYIDKNGEVYHLNDCHYDKINYQLYFDNIEKQRVENLKEEYGGIVEFCKVCKNNYSLIYKTIVISRNCGGSFSGSDLVDVDDGFIKLISIIKEKGYEQVMTDILNIWGEHYEKNYK